MAPKTKPATQPRIPLSKERVLLAAVAFADEHGIASLSMRKLGEVLGVEAMSLYNHVANKVQLLDGMVDLVFGEIDLPAGAAESPLPQENRPQAYPQRRPGQPADLAEFRLPDLERLAGLRQSVHRRDREEERRQAHRNALQPPPVTNPCPGLDPIGAKIKRLHPGIFYDSRMG